MWLQGDFSDKACEASGNKAMAAAFRELIKFLGAVSEPGDHKVRGGGG